MKTRNHKKTVTLTLDDLLAISTAFDSRIESLESSRCNSSDVESKEFWQRRIDQVEAARVKIDRAISSF